MGQSRKDVLKAAGSLCSVICFLMEMGYDVKSTKTVDRTSSNRIDCHTGYASFTRTDGHTAFM